MRIYQLSLPRAALAFGRLSLVSDSKIAVYDLGGGTFDISLLHLHEGCTKSGVERRWLLGRRRHRCADCRPAGRRLSCRPGIDLRAERMALQRLREAAERAKHELSTSLETEVNLPFIAAGDDGPKHLITSLTRVRLEELCEDLLARTIPPMQQVLKDAGWTVRDIDRGDPGGWGRHACRACTNWCRSFSARSRRAR